MSDQYAVIGHPIKHSKSPWIHANFARQLNEDITYSLLESDPETFTETVRAFIKKGGKGLNVTMPFKQEAWAMADVLSDHAKLAGAVNTLSFKPDGQVFGDNTDGVGLVRDLMDGQHIALAGKRVLMLGAGGAVRGVIQPLLEQQIANIHVVNRTVQKATDLAELFNGFGNISAGSYEDLATAGRFNVIINATASSLNGELPPLVPSIIASDCHAYDMTYTAQKTIFEMWCEEQGARSSSNGLGMLVEQAAESFSIWRGTRPQTKEVLAELTKQFS